MSYDTASGYPFEVALAPYLVAVGDRVQLRVHRSVVMQDTDPAVEHVNRYIRDCGMVLDSTETGLVDGMFGNTVQSRYATPEVLAFDRAIEQYQAKAEHR